MPLCTIRVPPLLLALKGPVLPVRVRLPDVVAKLRNADPSVTGIAMVDTGATRSCISKKAAEALALKPVGTITIGGVGGAKEHSLVRVTFEFVQQLQPTIGLAEPPVMQPVIRIADAEVVEVDIDNQGIMMLIGRDVLAASALTYDGPTGEWTLEIPRTRPPGKALPAGAPPDDPSEGGGQPGHSTPRKREKARTARKEAKKSRKKNRGK